MSQTLCRTLHRLAVAGTSVLLLGAVSLTAQAQGNLTATIGSGNSVTVGLTGHVPTPFGVYAGSINSYLAGGPAGYPTFFESYCVDINAAANLGSPYAVTESASSSLTRGGQVTWLAENAIYLYASNPGTVAEKRASLQLAIWNTLYDTDNTVNSGSFYLDTAPSNEFTLANLYLSASTGKTAVGVNNKISDNSGHGYQTFIRAGTPEPGAIAYLSVLGGGCLSVLGRRYRKSGSKRK